MTTATTTTTAVAVAAEVVWTTQGTDIIHKVHKLYTRKYRNYTQVTDIIRQSITVLPITIPITLKMKGFFER